MLNEGKFTICNDNDQRLIVEHRIDDKDFECILKIYDSDKREATGFQFQSQDDIKQLIIHLEKLLEINL